MNFKPLKIAPSLLFFGVPSLIACFGIYWLMPRLNQAGTSVFLNLYISMVIPMALLLVASFVAYKIEGHPFTWKAFSTRFRLKRITKKDWLYIGLLVISYILIHASLGFTSKWLMQFNLFSPPEFLPPCVDPRLEQKVLIDTFLGIPLKGQWWIAGVYFSILFFNIFGEEFWWRGYIFPRQELAFGKYVWIIHGLLWTFFHVFWRWDLLVLLPLCLVLSFVVYKTKNTWVPLIAHAIGNGIPLIGIIIGIIG